MIIDQIIVFLKAQKCPVKVSISDNYSQSKPTIPLVTVYLQNDVDDIVISGDVFSTTLTINFDIYSKPLKVEGSILNPRQVNEIITNWLTTAIRGEFGLAKTRTSPLIPYSQENSVYRRVITFTGVLTRNEYIYKK